ncbi:hypothetical protein OH76DRAFT_1395507, partial [Lentinus brumalis]
MASYSKDDGYTVIEPGHPLTIGLNHLLDTMGRCRFRTDASASSASPVFQYSLLLPSCRSQFFRQALSCRRRISCRISTEGLHRVVNVLKHHHKPSACQPSSRAQIIGRSLECRPWTSKPTYGVRVPSGEHSGTDDFDVSDLICLQEFSSYRSRRSNLENRRMVQRPPP